MHQANESIRHSFHQPLEVIVSLDTIRSCDVARLLSFSPPIVFSIEHNVNLEFLNCFRKFYSLINQQSMVDGSTL